MPLYPLKFDTVAQILYDEDRDFNRNANSDRGSISFCLRKLPLFDFLIHLLLKLQLCSFSEHVKRSNCQLGFECFTLF